MIPKNKTSWRKIRNAKLSTDKNVRVLVADVLKSTEKERNVIADLLGLFGCKPDNIISSEDLARLRKERNISKSSLWRITKKLEDTGILEPIPRVDSRHFYLLSSKFDKSLYKLARAYRKFRKKEY